MRFSGGSSSDVTIDKQNDHRIKLQKFRSINPTTTKKIAWIGDSTSDSLFSQSIGGYPLILGNAQTDWAYKRLGKPGMPFYNVTHLDFGISGQTAQNFANDAIPGCTVSDIAAQSPDLNVFSFGINDVRLGTTTKDQLKTYITNSVNKMRAAMPNADIILRMPNPLLYDSANANGYIDAPVSLNKVQDYTDRMRLAYRELKGIWSNVYVLDVMGIGTNAIFSETCNTLANKGYYQADALHPAGVGYAKIIEEVASSVSDMPFERFGNYDLGHTARRYPMSQYRSHQATQINATDPHLFYPWIVEDTDKYNLIMSGYIVSYTQGSFIDIASNHLVNLGRNFADAVLQNDIILQIGVTDTVAGSQGEVTEDGAVAWKYTGNSTTENGNHLRLLSIPAGYPKNATGNIIKIYRPRPSTQKAPYDPNFCAVVAAPDFTAVTLRHVVQRFGVATQLNYESATGPTTGGTIDVKKNGTTIATITVANGATTGTVSGTFVGTNTKGTSFNEGDIIDFVINAGFVAGTFPKIRLSNH
jgi:lysophospholipase L1-like esterase